MSAVLQTELAGVRLSSPLVLASGILGVSASSLWAVAQAGAGAVTTKSFCRHERAGHPGPAIISYGPGLLNAVGLSNPGAEAAVQEIREFKARTSTPLVASIFGGTVEEFREVAALAASGAPDLIEVNVSCPNVASEYGAPFESEHESLGRVTRAVVEAASAVPVAVKLSVNFGAIGRAARICAEQGARAITAINTVGPGMVIDVGIRRPVLANRVGGLSGPAILPLAVRAVFEIRRAVDLPIIAVGGVTDTDGALQLIMAGATAVGIGSGIHYRGLGLFREINAGLEEFIRREGLGSLAEIVGAAHDA